MSGSGRQFWTAFQERLIDIEDHMSSRRMRPAFEIVESNLQMSGFDLAFELAGGAGAYFLIFSPEGNEEDAMIVDSLLSDSPELPGWTFLGRKPRKPMPDPVVFAERIFGLRLHDCRFVLTRGPKCAIDVFSSSFSDVDADVADACASTFLFHLLGEALVMERIDVIRARPEPAPQNALSPQELVAAIDRMAS